MTTPLQRASTPEAATSACCPPPSPTPDLPESEEARDRAIAEVAKALAHPVRVAIVRRLRATEACVSDIVGELPLAQSTVSQHLKVLKGAGLVRGDVEGPRVSYCLEPGALRLFSRLVEEL